MPNQLLAYTAVVFAFVVSTATPARAQNATAPGTPQADRTIYSIGVEWPITGDANHNAVATVSYRVAGTTGWTPALPLVRIDLNGANMLAGSILFLTPDTTYDVALSLSDPDGGGDSRVVTATTRPVPSPPAGGRTLHVVPGSGAGDGSGSNPFKGLAAAQAAAQPGDTLLLHKGDYGGRIRLDKSGTVARYILWKAYGDGEALLRGIDVSGSHVWIDGLTIRDQAYGVMAYGNPDDDVVTRCSFYNNHNAIYMQEGGRNWYIADNTIVGDTPYLTQSLDGEGIDLNVTGGHTVAHNSISSVADGISYPAANVDIFGNDIFDTSDDGIEADYGGANVRIWRNRIHDAVHNGISFQPQAGGPWYIVRNQIVGNVEAAFKFRTTDRFVLLHNTIVNWGTAWPGDAMMCCNEDHLLRAIARNNLWISIQGGQIWGFDAGVVDWRTDLDYDGFDWGASVVPFAYGGTAQRDLPSLTAASGLEPHGLRLSKETCFETFDVPNAPPAPVPPQVMALRSTCAAIDHGAVLPNVNDGRFSGAAPDLGAYEYGQTAPVFGPRTAPTAVLTALPATIEAGGASTLSWTTTDATMAAIEPSLGSVDPGGSTTVTPLATTTYTLTATGAGGVAIATATVTVAAEPPDSTPYTGTPIALPGTIEAENFDNGGAGVAYHDTSTGNSGGEYRTTDVDVQSTADAGGGYNIGWAQGGEWLNYTVSVAATGTYTIQVRVANPGAGGTFHVEANGIDKTGALAVPNTGDWQAWTTVSRTGVTLAAGTQVLRLVTDGVASSGAVANFNWLRVTAEATGSTPYGGTPIALPGTIEAENFDNGGGGVAYDDTSTGNSGGEYRTTDVDVQSTADAGGGYNVGWAQGGEWLNYTVSVAATGTYTIQVRVANPGAGGTFHVEANGIDKTGALAVPNTGDWQAWTTVSRTGVTLAAGTQVLRLVMDGVASSGAVANFNWLRVTAEASGSTPYGGTPIGLPGTIEAENFDNGGADVAYRDTSTGNSGGEYRPGDVDLQSTGDAGGGYNVGWVEAGEWLKYTVDVAAAGTYTIQVRVANPAVGGTFHIEVNGADRTGPLAVPSTGDWQAWTTVTRTGVTLAAGRQVLTVVMDAVAGSLAVGNFNWIRVAAESGGGSTPFTGSPFALPGTIQVEQFDNGGAEVAYHDTTLGNSGGEYRSTDVDIQSTSDDGGGYNVGWSKAGEWLAYSANVAAAGTYAVDVRVACPGPGGTFHIEINGVDATGPLKVPATGDYQAWTTVSRAGVALAAGPQVLRLVIDAGGSSGSVGNFNWIAVR